LRRWLERCPKAYGAPIAQWRQLDRHLLASKGIQPKAIIGMTPTGTPPSGALPHRTEDTPVDPATIHFIKPALAPWFGANAPPTAASLAAAFQQHVQTTGEWNGARKGAYVQAGTQVSSLAAVRINRPSLQFFEDNFDGKRSLRAYITDADTRYSLPVVAKDLRELCRAGNVASVNQFLPNGGVLHVRVGLARAWSGQPGRCTVMINGVYW
jgi:hypothetical protein